MYDMYEYIYTYIYNNIEYHNMIYYTPAYHRLWTAAHHEKPKRFVLTWDGAWYK